MKKAEGAYLVVVVVLVVFLLLLLTIISIILIYQKRQLKVESEIRKAKGDFENEILKTRLEIKEQTLKNISQEIHDNVGQILSLANVTLTSVNLQENSIVMASINNAMSLVSQAINDLRNMSKTLDPDNIKNVGLKECLQFELDLLEKTGAYKTSMLEEGPERQFHSSKQLLIYRIVQEAINNIIKHSQAKTIKISLFYHPDIFEVIVTDNGVGFEDLDEEKSTIDNLGSGLRNMKYRASLMKGELEINGIPSKGTTIKLTIPENPPT